MTLLNSSLAIIKSLIFYIFDSIALLQKRKQKNSELVLLIRQDAIGDFIIWLDTAKEYKKLYSSEKYKIILIGNSSWSDLAESLPYWDEVIPINIKKFKSLTIYRWNLLKKIQNLGAKIAIQPTYSREFYNGDSLIRASNANTKISSDGDMSNRNWLKKKLADNWHSELIPASKKLIPELERNSEFFQNLSKKPHNISYPKLNLKNSNSSFYKDLGEYYVLFPGVSSALRQWPVDAFAEIANRIYKKSKLDGFLDGSPDEKPIGESIQSISNARLEWVGTSIVELPKLLKYAKFVVCGETSAAYISAAVETSVICILSGAYFGRFLPLPILPGKESKIQTVSYPMSCYNCNANCKFKLKYEDPAPCVYNVSVDTVWEKVESLL